ERPGERDGRDPARVLPARDHDREAGWLVLPPQWPDASRLPLRQRRPEGAPVRTAPDRSWTRREGDIVERLALTGESDRAIGAFLGITESTVGTHMEAIRHS